MPSALFGRCWRLTVRPSGSNKAVVYDSAPRSGHPLRMQFEVQRTLHSAANKATISLTNVSPATRKSIDRGAYVTLDCAYGPSLADAPSRVYVGSVMEKTVQQQGGDVELRLECADSQIILANCHVSLAYSTSVTLAQMVQDVCAQLQIELNGAVYEVGLQAVQRLPAVTFPAYVIAGPAKKVLDDLLKPRGIEWSIQNGSLLIQGAEGLTSLQATSLSKTTGLLEVPTISKTGVQFRALLQAAIQPGMAVKLITADSETSGTFRVCETTHKGDTYGGDWCVEAECQGLALPLAAYTKPSGGPGSFADAQMAQGDEAEEGEGAVD